MSDALGWLYFALGLPAFWIVGGKAAWHAGGRRTRIALDWADATAGLICGLIALGFWPFILAAYAWVRWGAPTLLRVPAANREAIKREEQRRIARAIAQSEAALNAPADRSEQLADALAPRDLIGETYLPWP